MKILTFLSNKIKCLIKKPIKLIWNKWVGIKEVDWVGK